MSTALVSLGAALHSLMPTAVRSQARHTRSRSLPASGAHPILPDFQNQLQAKVEIIILQQQEQPESYNFSASWLEQALEVVLLIYSHLEDLYPRMQIENDIDGNWLSQHMEDLVNLLDVCNVLRERISEIKKHTMSVQIALHGLLQAHAQIPCTSLSHEYNMMNIQIVKAKSSLGSFMDELRKNKDMESKLAKCMSILKRMADSLHPTRATTTSIGESRVEKAIKEAKAVAIFSCTALVAALSFNTPCRSFMPGAGFLMKKNKVNPSHFPPLFDINCMGNMIQHKIKKATEMQKRRSSSSKFLLEELDRVDLTHGNLNNLLDRYLVMSKTSMLSTKLQDELRESIHAVNMSITEMESAFSNIDHRINDLFRFLISSRVTLLNSLTAFSS